MSVLSPLTGTLTPLGASTARINLLSGLLAYWKLNEASGNATDSVGTYPLTQTNSPVATSPGKLGDARRFVRTSSQYLSTADNADFSGGASKSLTIAGWVRFTTIANSMTMIHKGTGTNAATLEYRLEFFVSNSLLRWSVSNGSSLQALDASTFGVVTTATWYFFAVWRDHAAASTGIRINATAPNTTTLSGNLNDTAGAFYLATVLGTGSYLNGDLDEIGVWNRVLSSTELDTLYNSGTGLTYPFS